MLIYSRSSATSVKKCFRKNRTWSRTKRSFTEYCNNSEIGMRFYFINHTAMHWLHSKLYAHWSIAYIFIQPLIFFIILNTDIFFFYLKWNRCNNFIIHDVLIFKYVFFYKQINIISCVRYLEYGIPSPNIIWLV